MPKTDGPPPLAHVRAASFCVTTALSVERVVDEPHHRITSATHDSLFAGMCRQS